MAGIQRALSRAILTALVLATVLMAARLAVGPPNGLRAEYFEGELPGGTPVIAGTDPQPSTAVLQRRWLGANPDIFSVRWFGALAITRAGQYTFSLSSDDGSALTVDGVRLIDNSGRHGLETRSGTVALSAGSHQVLVEYSQAGGAMALDWTWARDAGAPVPVPGWALTPTRATPWLVVASRVARSVAIALLGLGLLLMPVAAWARGWSPARYPHAWALALFTVLAVWHTWPLASDPAHLTRHDNRDAVLNTWIVAWVARTIVLHPLQLFDANIFYPERYTLAYSEPLIVQSLMGAPLLWLGVSPVLVSNLLLLAGLALSGWAMSLVIRRWTGDWTAGLVSGALFAFNAHSLSRIPHLQAQHVEFLPFALYGFDRLLEAPSTRNAARLAAWFVLQGLTSVYLLAITAFALIASMIARLPDLRRHPLFTLQALVIAGVLSGVVLAPFLLPYWLVSRELGLVRSLDSAAQYSAEWKAYLATPARVHVWWSSNFYGGNVLFPGVLALVLTAVALIRGGALHDRRARMCVAMGLLGVALSFGPSMPGYAVVYRLMPLLQGIRATARFGYLATCATAMLAGFGVVALRRVMSPGRWRVMAPALVVVAALEATAAPLGLVRVDPVPDIYATVPRTPGTVVIELPFYGSRSAQFHAHYMLNSTRHWQPLVNGYSGFQPPSYYENAPLLQQFPGDAAIDRMRALGVTHVFLHADQLPGDAIAAADARPELERVASFGSIVLYRLVR